jgi:putative membrane protein
MRLFAVLADADGWDGHMGCGGGWWVVIWGTLMVVGLVVLIVWLVRTTSGGSVADPGGDSLVSARRILGERYARGELFTEEYRDRLDEVAR